MCVCVCARVFVCVWGRRVLGRVPTETYHDDKSTVRPSGTGSVGPTPPKGPEGEECTLTKGHMFVTDSRSERYVEGKGEDSGVETVVLSSDRDIR